jgi:hypothetical protein
MQNEKPQQFSIYKMNVEFGELIYEQRYLAPSSQHRCFESGGLLVRQEERGHFIDDKMLQC